jgi:hypothetical protein
MGLTEIDSPVTCSGDADLVVSAEDEPSQTSILTLRHPPPNTIMRLSSDLGKDPDPGKDGESDLTDTRD